MKGTRGRERRLQQEADRIDAERFAEESDRMIERMRGNY